MFIPAGDRMDEDLGSRTKVLEAKSLIWYPAVVNNSFRPGWFYHAKEDGQQRNVEKLMENYYTSVGKNAVWLLNFSPDKRGLINDDDVKNATGLGGSGSSGCSARITRTGQRCGYQWSRQRKASVGAVS